MKIYSSLPFNRLSPRVKNTIQPLYITAFNFELTIIFRQIIQSNLTTKTSLPDNYWNLHLLHQSIQALTLF